MEALERNCQNPHDNSDTTSSKLGDFLVELANIFYAQCAALGAESDEELRAVRESLLALIYMRHCQCDPLLLSLIHI